jgi:hypothetical protein
MDYGLTPPQEAESVKIATVPTAGAVFPRGRRELLAVSACGDVLSAGSSRPAPHSRTRRAAKAGEGLISNAR